MLCGMNGIQIGYARVSTADQDLTSQRDALLRLGVLDSNIYVDHGLTGTNRARPGLREALAAVREGDTLVVTKLDRLARSVQDARDIADELTTKGVAQLVGPFLTEIELRDRSRAAHLREPLTSLVEDGR
jgi:DNA invertase Pin-like site-specific DNA recombinase